MWLKYESNCEYSERFKRLLKTVTSETLSALFMKAKIGTLRYFLLSNAVYFFLELSLQILKNLQILLKWIFLQAIGTHTTYQGKVSMYLLL